MALASVINAIVEILSLPFANCRPKSRMERLENAFAIAFWLIILAAAVLGLATLAK